MPLEHRIQLEPHSFGPQLREYIHARLHDEVEGTCSGKHGYVIAVASIEDIGTGRIVPGQGIAEYNVKYRAVVFKPFKNQVIDAQVTTVNKLIPVDMEFDPNANPPCYKTQDETAKLEKGEWVRVKIVGTRVDATEIFAIGTIKEDYLGVLEI